MFKVIMTSGKIKDGKRGQSGWGLMPCFHLEHGVFSDVKYITSKIHGGWGV